MSDSIMHSWKESIQKALDKKYYRCKMLAGHHNPDYLYLHANECKQFALGSSKECMKRLEEEQIKRLKNAFQIVNAPKIERFNRAK